KQIQGGKVKGKYPPQLRAFALTLHFYSPKAYCYVRQTFMNKLPASSTIRSWYSSTDGSPGFSTESLQILKIKSQAAENEGKQLYGCLMMDEMAIRKQVQWDHSARKFIGYIDYGSCIHEPEELPFAKEALVYLINGVNARWKIPVAYFLIDSLTAQERAEITRKVLDFLVPSGITIVAL
ncbi:THAP domain-containing protein 9, partial [Harpegnathos saltator]